MPELLEEQRESWGTRGGFILAAVGSAVGLGNLWGFPYKLYSFGGGAFLIPYVIALLVVGIPLMVLEFSLGHYTQRAAPDAFKRGHRRLEIVGWWGIILGFIIVTYYPVILAYCFSFLWYSIVGMFNGGQLPWAGKGVEGVSKANDFFFESYLGHEEGLALGGFRWNIFLPLLIAWGAMYLCIFRGVRLVGKIVWLTVPLPWLMLLILAVRGMTLEGSMQGLAYYLDPVWSELLKPVTWRYAFGQVFFSLSLAFGVMITYASFLHRKSDLNNNAVIIGLADFATSFVAGLAVFATLGGMAFVTQQAGNPVAVENVAKDGPSLAFVAFPYALAQLPYSAYFSFIFFFALVTLGIDSAFSITESVLASIVDKSGWRRAIVLPAMSVVGLGFGLVFLASSGLNWLGTIDGFVNGTRGIALLGLLECVAIGWLWRVGTLRRHANSRSDWQLGKWWDYMIRLVIPVVLGTLFFWQLFDDIHSESGFFITAQGQWKLGNCVGVGVLVLAPVVSLALTLVKGRQDTEPLHRQEQDLQMRGKSLGLLSFLLATAAGALFVIVLIAGSADLASRVASDWVVWVLAAGGIGGMVLGNYVLDRHNTAYSQASWFARWGGIIATMDVSAFIAVVLFRLARRLATEQAVEEAVSPIRDKLSGVSYAILAAIFLIIIGGLGWCFYKALAAAGSAADPQSADEVGDESGQRPPQ
jgi:NSS family neurotransmitter:Na+ symporter